MSAPDLPDLIPARMINEFAYCPRLAYLEWVQQEWKENAETLEGAWVHRRVDRPESSTTRLHQRSIHLSSDRLGVTAVIDLIEREGNRIRPVDYKRGKRPPVKDGAWEPERVQLCVQGLLLREHGYECNEGLIYFAASRDRVRIRFTKQLVGRTMEILAEMRRVLGQGRIPAPLEDSPKCPRCSLVSVCLPEETRFLQDGGKIRPIAVADPGSHPLVVQNPGTVVRLQAGRFVAERRDEPPSSSPVEHVSQLVLMGSVQCTAAVIRECCQRDIPVVHMSGTGWFLGITRGATHKNVEIRAEQFAAARDGTRRLEIARALVAAKIFNSRVMLRRNGEVDPRDLEILAELAAAAERAADLEELLGIEGVAARNYFAAFSSMIKAETATGLRFDLEGRNRRPPRDPVNALLSLAYAMLTKDWVVTLEAIGLDPYMGLLHGSRYGKPGLALDLMEPFRPVIADSVVISALNNGEIRSDDFFEIEGGILLKPVARRRFAAAYERRMAMKVQHPIFGYSCEVRRLFEIEGRLAGRWLLGELPGVQPYRTR